MNHSSPDVSSVSLPHLSPIPNGSPFAAAVGATSAQVLRVTSDDLAPGHLRSGDYIVFQPLRVPEYEDMVIASVSNGGETECVMRRLVRRRDDDGNPYALLTMNDLSTSDLVVDLSNLTVHGVVVGVIRRY